MMTKKNFWEDYFSEGGYSQQGGSPLDLLEDEEEKYASIKDEIQKDLAPAYQTMKDKVEYTRKEKKRIKNLTNLMRR